MQRPNVIVAQSNVNAAASLAASLQKVCRSVYVAKSLEEVRAAVPKHRADIVIADLELMCLPEIERLHHEFGGVRIVCTHRVPDEQMWAESLQAGATDCCFSDDARAILASALGQHTLARSRAA